MDVNSDVMRAGANLSHSAADLAREAFEQLSVGTMTGGIFGNFSAAESFWAVARETHSNHLQRLRKHQNGLGVLGDKARRTANAFDELEGRNAAALRSVPWPITRA